MQLAPRLVWRGGSRMQLWRCAPAPAQHLRRLPISCRPVCAVTGLGDAAPAPTTAAGAAATPRASPAPALGLPPPPPGSIWYTAFPLQRCEEARADEQRLAQLFASPQARLLPVNGSRVLVVGAADASEGGAQPAGTAAQAPAWLQPASDAAGALDAAVGPIFLGLDEEGAPHFAGQVQGAHVDALAAGQQGAAWVAARTAGPEMSAGDAAIVATAAGLVAWHRDNLVAGASGAATASAQGGWSRAPADGGRPLYPRVDPAIITLVSAGDWALLGRKAGWPPGRYSTLAGFLEVGESLEEALVREVGEESGVPVEPSSVRYFASQPWPFPRSLMVGFTVEQAGTSSSGGGGLDLLQGPARAAAMDVGIRPDEVADALLPALHPPTPQPGEMEDVRWFHRSFLAAAVAKGPAAAPGGFGIPGPYSLAHRLILGWLEARAAAAGAGSAGAWPGAAGLEQVEVDGSGVFKYVLLRLSEAHADGESSPRSRLLVWGTAAAPYHNDILQRAKARVAAAAAASPGGPALRVEVLGGGRMAHHPEQGAMHVYGYSAAFGPAPHEVTAALLRRRFPVYDVTISYEGY